MKFFFFIPLVLIVIGIITGVFIMIKLGLKTFKFLIIFPALIILFGVIIGIANALSLY